MVSQDLHRKQVKEELNAQLEDSEQAYQSTELDLQQAQKEIKALRKCKALSTDYRKAHENKFLLYAAQDMSDDSPILAKAAQDVIVKEQAMKQFNLDLLSENVGLEKTLTDTKVLQTKQLASKDDESAKLKLEKEQLDEKDWHNDMAIIDLEEQLPKSHNELEEAKQQIIDYKDQLQHRAFGDDYKVVTCQLYRQLREVQDTIAAQQQNLIDQQLHIEELKFDNGQVRDILYKLGQLDSGATSTSTAKLLPKHYSNGLR